MAQDVQTTPFTGLYCKEVPPHEDTSNNNSTLPKVLEIFRKSQETKEGVLLATIKIEPQEEGVTESAILSAVADALGLKARKSDESLPARLQGISSEAKEWLAMCCYFNPDHPVPALILNKKFSTKRERNALFKMLVDNKLVMYDKKSETMSVPASLQTDMRSFFYPQGLAEAIELISETAIYVDKESERKKHGEVAEWVPHARSVLKYQGGKLASRGNIYIHLGAYEQYVVLNYKSALFYYYQALSLLREAYGNEHRDVHDVLDGIGLIFDELGHNEKDPRKACEYYSKALEYHQQAVEIGRRIYHDQHPIVATTLNCVGVSLVGLGKYDEGMKFIWEAYEIRQKISTHDQNHSSDLANSLHCIAWALNCSGQKSEALAYDQQARAIYEKIYGPQHPLIAQKEYLL